MLSRKLVLAVMSVLMLMAGAVQAGGDPAAGAALAVDCADCHGEDGKGDADVPALAGLDETYLIEQMRAFKSGERVDENELMPMYAEDLSEQDMADLAAFYISLGAN
ncbi:MAG: c-type cytochrome [Xanthomonadales bacterium]